MPRPRFIQYVERLGKFSDRQLREVFKRAQDECEKFPSLAELLRRVPPIYLGEVEERDGPKEAVGEQREEFLYELPKKWRQES